MIDPVLEEEIQGISEIVSMWDDLFAQVRKARAGGGVSDDSARAFLSLRGDIAGRYAAAVTRLEVMHDEQDELTQLLGRMSSLGAVVPLSDAQWRKIEEAGGRVAVGLQSLVGVLRDRQRALAGVSVGLLRARRVLGSWLCKLLYLVVGIIIIFIVLGKIIVYTKGTL